LFEVGCTVPADDPRVLAVVATPVGMRVLMARFFNHMVSENVKVFWGHGDVVSSSPTPRKRLAPTASRAPGG